MNIMTVEHLSKSYGEKILFSDASFGMDDRDKIGLIGVNGTGKSTFLRIIAGLDTPDGGQISIGNNVRVQFLAQNPPYEPTNTVLQQVFAGDDPDLVTMREYVDTMALLEKSPGNTELEGKLVRIGQEIDAAGTWHLESEAKTVLTKLGITKFDADGYTLRWTTEASCFSSSADYSL